MAAHEQSCQLNPASGVAERAQKLEAPVANTPAQAASLQSSMGKPSLKLNLDPAATGPEALASALLGSQHEAGVVATDMPIDAVQQLTGTGKPSFKLNLDPAATGHEAVASALLGSQHEAGIIATDMPIDAVQQLTGTGKPSFKLDLDPAATGHQVLASALLGSQNTDNVAMTDPPIDAQEQLKEHEQAERKRATEYSFSPPRRLQIDPAATGQQALASALLGSQHEAGVVATDMPIDAVQQLTGTPSFKLNLDPAATGHEALASALLGSPHAEGADGTKAPPPVRFTLLIRV
jgi:hypothetical protein